MKTKVFLAFICFVTGFWSCSDSEIALQTRSENSLSFEILTTNNGTVTVEGSDYSVTHTTGNEMSLIVNHTKASPMSFTASSVSITDIDVDMKLTAFSTSGSQNHDNKSMVIITANATNKLSALASPGNINFNALQIIGDEDDAE